MSKKYYRVLSIAGSDSGGGAGIQADLKTCSALGCYGMTAITALTAQNTVGVQACFAVPAKFVAQQLQSVLRDIGVDAVKIGMLHDADIVDVVAESIGHLACPIVLDPVMFSKNNSPLLEKNAIKNLIEKLIPLATLITPNIPEAECLSHMKIKNPHDMKDAAKIIQTLGAKNILIKGGHTLEKNCTDILYSDNKFYEFTEVRIHTNNTHGTGCTLSSAIACYLAKNYSLMNAVASAKKYLTGAIHSGSEYQLGNGFGPVEHLYVSLDR